MRFTILLDQLYLHINIELCNEVMYLGILFYFNGNFLQTQKRLSDQGRKAVFSLFNKIQVINKENTIKKKSWINQE
jgi:hypothetical protein